MTPRVCRQSGCTAWAAFDVEVDNGASPYCREHVSRFHGMPGVLLHPIEQVHVERHVRWSPDEQAQPGCQVIGFGGRPGGVCGVPWAALVVSFADERDKLPEGERHRVEVCAVHAGELRSNGWTVIEDPWVLAQHRLAQVLPSEDPPE